MTKRKTFSDTPRTDNAAVDSLGQPHHLVSADFARALERDAVALARVAAEICRYMERVHGTDATSYLKQTDYDVIVRMGSDPFK